MGSLTVQKLDSETRQPLPGVEFKIVYADGNPVSDNNGQTSSGGQYFTDENGEIRIRGITGTVIVTEENTIPGYTIDPNARTKTVTVNPDDAQTLTFFNAPKQTLIIQKYAAGTTAPLAGTAFYITDNKGAVIGQDNGEFVTDINGRIVITDLTPGITVTARETRSAEGYALDTNPKSIAIQSGNVQTLTFYNSPLQSVIIRKYIQNTTTPISGVTFMLTDGNGAVIGEYITNENGEIILNNIAPGTVIHAKEIRSAAGYALNGTPQSLTVRDGGNNVLTFYDEPLTTLIIRKYAENTENQPLSGVEFKVTDGNGTVIGSDNGIYYTDRNGEITIPNLQPGMTLTVRETKAADGFILDGTPQTIQIKSGKAQSLTFWNTPEHALLRQGEKR